MIKNLLKEITDLADPAFAEHHLRFFKTGKGQYGEGDMFYGLKVPDIRKLAKNYYQTIDLDALNKLIKNPYHEVRLLALIMMVYKYKKTDELEQEKIYNLYLNNVEHINNWDLVDTSAEHLVGGYLFNRDRQKLWDLANSGHLWSERISVMSTFYFIKQGDYSYTVELSKHFLPHKHDLMHKATGWMLREMGKRDIKALYAFLDEFHKIMPRTMLRYAIEKLSAEKRAFYMKKD